MIPRSRAEAVVYSVDLEKWASFCASGWTHDEVEHMRYTRRLTVTMDRHPTVETRRPDPCVL